MKEVDSLLSFEQDSKLKRTKKHIPLSATLIASVLLAFTPTKHVVAQEIEEDPDYSEIEILSQKLHSLLGEIDQESTVSLNEEEIKEIQRQLLDLAEEENNQELIKTLNQENVTIEELAEVIKTLPHDIAENDNVILEEENVEKDETSEEQDIVGEVESEAVIEEQEESDLENTVAEEVIDSEDVDSEDIDSGHVAEENKTLEAEEKLVEELKEELVEELEEAEETLEKQATMQAATLSVKSSAEKTVKYTVRPGDTLNSIARNHNVSVNHIAQLNNITNVNLISVGQVLTIHGTPGNLEDLSKPLTNQEFVETLGKHAQVAAKEQNLYASVIIAQAALESGYGTSGLSSAPNHNLYGMKGSYQGESVIMRTREYSTAAGWHYVNAHFKKYPSHLESLADHAVYIRTGPSWANEFYYGVWRENTQSYRDATAWLQGRYATDPAYARKLNDIIEAYNLTRFDDYAQEDDSVIIPPVNDSEKPVRPSTGDQTPDTQPDTSDLVTYRVQRVDTLSYISASHRMSVHELKTINKLTSDLIIIGQNLQVKKKVSTPTPDPAPSVPNISNTTTYTVKRGDTLIAIANTHKMSLQELKVLNNLRSDLILVGQSLQVKEQEQISQPVAPKPTTPIAPTESNSITYTIKRGDTLSQIARAHKTSVAELKRLNNLQSDLIYVGQKLTVAGTSKPGPGSSSQSSTQPDNSSNSTTVNHTVRSGETLSVIARKYKVSLANLASWNGLTNPNLIRVNQKLTVRTQSSKPTENTTTQSYLIKAGDTLSHIARQYNTTVHAIKGKNNLQSDLIFVGQKLKI